MNRSISYFLSLLAFIPALMMSVHAAEDGDRASRLKSLDAYWEKVSQAVKTGDFEAYKSTCHSLGVLVSGSKKTPCEVPFVCKKLEAIDQNISPAISLAAVEKQLP